MPAYLKMKQKDGYKVNWEIKAKVKLLAKSLKRILKTEVDRADPSEMHDASSTSQPDHPLPPRPELLKGKNTPKEDSNTSANMK